MVGGSVHNNHISRIEEQRNLYQKQVEDLEKDLKTALQTTESLRNKLMLERVKNQIYRNIITVNTNISVPDIIEMKEDGMHVYNYIGGGIPVVVHNYIKGSNVSNVSNVGADAVNKEEEVKEYLLDSTKEKEEKPSQTFRTVKNKVEVVEEEKEKEERKELVKKIDENMEEVRKENFDYNFDEVSEIIEQKFNELQKRGRTFNKLVKFIGDERRKLLGVVNLNKYSKIVGQHIKRFSIIFTTRKNFNKSKINEAISRGLTTLEKRLASFEKYYTESLNDMTEIQNLRKAMAVTMDYAKEYTPFNWESLYNSMYNYGLLLFPIRETLERVFVNPYKFHNIVYINIPKSTEDDPYSFYILDKIDEDKRAWRMDCRLEDFSNQLASACLQYCIREFRRIYYDIFQDYIFRSNYTEKAQIYKEEGRQLIDNIILLSKPIEFCNLLRKIIVKNCTLEPSEIDKTNLTADDNYQRKKFNSYIEKYETLKESFHKMFDNISDENIEDIIEENSKNIL